MYRNYLVTIRDYDGCIVNQYHDAEENDEKMLDAAYSEWGDEIWVEVTEE